jgi:hypothetical protein
MASAAAGPLRMVTFRTRARSRTHGGHLNRDFPQHAKVYTRLSLVEPLVVPKAREALLGAAGDQEEINRPQGVGRVRNSLFRRVVSSPRVFHCPDSSAACRSRPRSSATRETTAGRCGSPADRPPCPCSRAPASRWRRRADRPCPRPADPGISSNPARRRSQRS